MLKISKIYYFINYLMLEGNKLISYFVSPYKFNFL